MKGKPRILLVDSEPGRQRGISHRLTAASCEPIEATNGCDGFPPPVQHNPDETPQAEITKQENAHQESERSHQKPAHAWN